MPMPRATGVWLSMPTSAVSSAEKMFGCVFSTRPSATGFAVHQQRRLATLAGAAAVVDEVERDGDRTGRQRLRRGNREALHPEEVVDVRRLAVLHVERPSAEAPALRQDGAIGARRRNHQLRGDLARPVLDVHEGVFQHPLHALVEGERGARPQDVGPARERRIGALDGPVVDRQHVVLLGFLHEQRLHLLQLRALLGRQVLRQAEVVLHVVELPDVGRQRRQVGRLPRRAMDGPREPAARCRSRGCRTSRSTASCAAPAPRRR